MWNESSRHSSFSSSRKSLRIASLLARWMFEKTGTAWGRILKGLRSRPRRFPSGTDMADHIAPLKDTAQNTSCSRIRHSVALSTDTHRQHHKTQTARFPAQHGPPGSSEVPGAHFHFPKTPNWAPLVHFLNVPQVVEHNMYKVSGPMCKNRSLFAMSSFPNVRSKFLHNNVSNNMYVVVDPLGVSTDSRIVQAFMFFDRQKGGQTGKKGPSIGTHVSKLGPRTSHRRPLGPKRGPFWVWDGVQRTRATRPPCKTVVRSHKTRLL